MSELIDSRAHVREKRASTGTVELTQDIAPLTQLAGVRRLLED